MPCDWRKPRNKRTDCNACRPWLALSRAAALGMLGWLVVVGVGQWLAQHRASPGLSSVAAAQDEGA
ncbi:MAG: hypothetical protein WD872_02685, partial [Pirellulaceae bacterium]